MLFNPIKAAYQLLSMRFSFRLFFSTCSLLACTSLCAANPANQANDQLEFLLWFDRYAINNKGEVIDPLDLDMLQQLKNDDRLVIKNGTKKTSLANTTTLKKGEHKP